MGIGIEQRVAAVFGIGDAAYQGEKVGEPDAGPGTDRRSRRRAGDVLADPCRLALDGGLAIDDFGTGYSCLSYLPKLAFDALKIDRSFVSELEYRPETKAMVHSLVTLDHNLNMRVIVEGVETPQQLELIQKFGGNEVQGFLLGRPTGDPESQLRAALDQKVMITPDALKASDHATESDSATTVE